MGVYVRVRLRGRSSGREVTCVAVVNTGFRSETPDIVLPVKVAEQLGLWPLTEAYLVSAEVVGGEVRMYFLERAVEVTVVEEDRTSRTVVSNVLIEPGEREVLISDCLAEELGIQILFPKRGIWRFVDDPPGMLRESAAGEG